MLHPVQISMILLCFCCFCWVLAEWYLLIFHIYVYTYIYKYIYIYIYIFSKRLCTYCGSKNSHRKCFLGFRTLIVQKNMVVWSRINRACKVFCESYLRLFCSYCFTYFLFFFFVISCNCKTTTLTIFLPSEFIISLVSK